MRRTTLAAMIVFTIALLSVSAVFGIQYITPSNGANQSIGASNLLFLDNTNGRIGIGTTSPSDLLHLNRANGNASIRLTNANTTVIITYNSTGAQQTFVVPTGVTNITYDVVGAKGGTGSAAGGAGGRVNGTMNVTAGTVLYLYVGGVGGSASGSTRGQAGSNGGGPGGGAPVSGPSGTGGGGGGGASDIRVGGTALVNRTIVAGGGGGGGGAGGGAGGASNTDGTNGAGDNNGEKGYKGTAVAAGAGGSYMNAGTAGSSSTGGDGGDGSTGCGSFAVGGGGGGGGGYYGGGGGGGGDDNCVNGGGGGGGGGGSNLAPNGSTNTSSYNTAGSGYIILTYTLPNDYVLGTDLASGTFQISRNTSTSADFTLNQIGYVGIGTNQPTTKLQVNANTSGYIASFSNIGNDQNNYGLQVRAGANDGSGTTYYLTAYDGDGDITGYVRTSSGTFSLVDVSDRNTKTGIKKRDFDALSKVSGVDVVEYTRKQNPNGPKITGFVAQDLQKVYPEAVATGPDGKLGVAKAELVPLLFKAIQEQENKIYLQQQQIEALAQGKTLPKGGAGSKQFTSQIQGNSAIQQSGNDIILQLGTDKQDVVMVLG